MKTNKIKLLLLFIAITQWKFINAQSYPYVVPNTDWIQYYSQADTMLGAPSSIDANSNVYTTGYSGLTTASNLIALKYDSTGALQYAYAYNNGSFDIGNAIKIDASGNAYLAGISTGTTGGTLRDYIVIKLNSSGTSQWVKRYDRGASNNDEASAVCVDASGNVYVTGKSKNSSGNFDIVTLKLNGLNGNILWTHIYTGSGLDDMGTGIVLSSNGSYVYVTGNTTNSTSGSNIVTFALNTSNGTTYWSPVITNGSASGTDKSNGIILVGSDVVICGEETNSTTGVDYKIIKYNGSSGSIVWQHSYDYSNSSNRATALAKDSAGNIGVVGTVLNGSTYEYHTVLYSNGGNQYGVNIESTGLAISSKDPSICNDTIAHHWYVSGEKLKSTKDVFVYQISPSGNTAWKKTIDSQNNDVDAATSIVVNGIGVVFVGALSKNSSANYDNTTIKLNQTPVYFPPDLGTPEQNDPNFVFQANMGQLLSPTGTVISQDEVGYYNQGNNPASYFGKNHITNILTDRDTILDSLVRVDMKFTGSNQLAEIYNYEPIDALKHYFTMSSAGITDVKSYKRLFIPNAYPNIDIHHYSNMSGLKTFFVFKTPSESMGIVRLKIEGADSTAIDGSGQLIAYTPLGSINYGVLTAYQATFNTISQTYVQVPLTANWSSLSTNMYGFSISSSIPFWPIVVYASKAAVSTSTVTAIDNLHWATFVGDVGDEEMYRNKTDKKDNLYIGGRTTAINYPLTPGAISSGPGSSTGQLWGIMNKFRDDGKLLYGTYYGGTGAVSACAPAITTVLDITVDSLYNIYLVGQTSSSNLITKTISVTGALNHTTNAWVTGGNCNDAFIAKLNPSGNTLKFASYWGGSDVESFTSIDYLNGRIYIGGGATSTNCPLSTPQSGAHWQTTGDGIYLNLDTSGSVIHNTKVSQRVIDATVDKNGNYYQVASTWGSYGLTTVTGPSGFFTQPTTGSVVDWTLQRFTNNSNQLDWSTYIGGNSADEVKAMTIRDSILAITGLVASTNFTIVKTASDSGEVARNNDNDFVNMKFDLTTGKIIWSAFFATFHDETPTGIALDKDFNLYVSGNVKCGVNTGTNTSCAPSRFKLFSYPGSGYYYQAPTGSAFIGMETFLLGYNSKNQRKWTTLYSSSSNANTAPNHDDRTYGLTMNNSGKLFMLGHTTVKNNSLPMVQWNNVCYYDNACADAQASGAADGFVAMWDINEFKIVGINEQESTLLENQEILLFPNPNSGIFTLRFSKAISTRIEVSMINILGQSVFTGIYDRTEKNEIELNAANLARGVYFVNISEGGSATKTIKFIIE